MSELPLHLHELSRAGAFRPVRKRGARAHSPLDVMNEVPLRQPLRSIIHPSGWSRVAVVLTSRLISRPGVL